MVYAGHRGTLDASPLRLSPHGTEKPVSRQTYRTELLGSSPHVAERQELLSCSINTSVHFNTHIKFVSSCPVATLLFTQLEQVYLQLFLERKPGLPMSDHYLPWSFLHLPWPQLPSASHRAHSWLDQCLAQKLRPHTQLTPMSYESYHTNPKDFRI